MVECLVGISLEAEVRRQEDRRRSLDIQVLVLSVAVAAKLVFRILDSRVGVEEEGEERILRSLDPERTKDGEQERVVVLECRMTEGRGIFLRRSLPGICPDRANPHGGIHLQPRGARWGMWKLVSV